MKKAHSFVPSSDDFLKADIYYCVFTFDPKHPAIPEPKNVVAFLIKTDQ